MDRIIRTIRRYSGADHAWLQGERAVIVAVRRGDLVLQDDESIGTLCADDRIEFAPILMEYDGVERATLVCANGTPRELGPVEGEWAGTMPGLALCRMHTARYLAS